MDWNLLQSFLATAEEGSLSGAAKALSISQPTIGRHVSELEERLGVSLFVRSVKGLRLTEEGTALVEHARTMREGADAVARIATGQSEEVAGSVRVTASEIVAAHVLPAILAAFRKAQPAIAVELVASNDSDNLLRREADIAVRMYRPAQADVITRKVGEHAIAAYAHRAYLEGRKTPENFDDLMEHDIIGQDRGDDIVEAMRQMGYSVTPDFFSFRCDNHLVCWQALRAGLGVGFAPVFLAARNPELVPLDLPSIPPLPVWLTTHRDVRTSRRIRLAYDFLAEALIAHYRDGGQ